MLLSVCFLLIAAGAAVIYTPASFDAHPAEQLFTIKRGTSVRKIAADLKEAGLVRFDYPTYLYFRLLNKPVKAGTYKLSPSLSLYALYAYLQTGKQELIKVTLPEGLTISKTAAILEERQIIAADAFLAAAENTTLLQSYGITGTSAEGFLFPDTYFFTPSMASSSVIDMMVKNFFEHIRANPTLASLPPDELQTTLVLASIVEREYRVADEAPLIASVFKNRIAKNIGLYSCATIEYIITEIQGKAHPDVITYDDLKIDNPYNTYKWAGLPPTPISNPGMIALEAAADTPKTNYYYFRLKDEETGRHAFSEHFDEHIQEGVRYKTKKAAES